MSEQAPENNRILVILGAGRTGTSLLTRILISLGMTGSTHEVPLSEQNPAGFYEDNRIVRCHMDILSQLGAHAYLPLGNDFLQTPGIGRYIKQLRDIAAGNIEAADTIWGFKDPRTPSLLPLWMRVFNSGKIVPTYILAVRDPASAVTSMHKQYSDQTELAELVWLLRTCEALYHTGGNCFIVHYEDWFTGKGSKTAEQLLTYTELDRYWNLDKQVDDTLSSVVKSNLNRAVFNEYDVQNRHVRQLYKALKNCQGDRFDRQALMDVVMDCRKSMQEFSGWSTLAQKFYHQARQKNENLLNQTRQKNKEFNDLLIRCKDLTDSNEQLRIRALIQKKEQLQLEKTLAGTQQELTKAQKQLTKTQKQLTKTQKQLTKTQKQISRLERKTFLLETSTSFQIGQHFINAFAKPGKNTLFFPFYLLRTLLASRAIRK